MQPSNTADSKVSRYGPTIQESSYTRDTGLLVLPVAGPDGTAPAIMKTHAVIGYRTVEFDSAKEGSPPLFPSMGDTSFGDMLLEGTLIFPLPTIGGAQNQYDYCVRGVYSYVQYGPLMTGDTSNGSLSSGSSGTVYGPRGNGSQYQTGRYPYIPTFINAMIVLGSDPGDPESPAYIDPGDETGYFNPTLPTGTSASTTIDVTGDYAYWDTTFGPTFFSPSLIV